MSRIPGAEWVLVDRGGNTLLIDKAANVMQRWNQAVRETSVMINQ